MNLLVILRAVRDPAGFTVNRKAQKIFVNRDNYICNPGDRNALEAALQLAQSQNERIGEGQGGRVTVVAFGRQPAEMALRDARAAGAARAILVKDDAFMNADAPVLANALQRVVEHMGGVELVLLGNEVLDADLAQAGPRLAQALDWPFIAGAHQLSVNGLTLTAITRRPDGFHKLEAGLPAVVSVAVDSNKPRYAPGAQIINIYQAKDGVEVLTAGDLGLSEADLTPLTERRGESFPPERELGNRLEGSLDETATQLATVIRKS